MDGGCGGGDDHHPLRAFKVNSVYNESVVVAYLGEYHTRREGFYFGWL